jgi:hypothetical protein
MAAATVIGGCAGAGCFAEAVFTARSAAAPRKSRGRGRERRRDLLVRFGSGGRGAFTGRTKEGSLGVPERKIHREENSQGDQEVREEL